MKLFCTPVFLPLLSSSFFFSVYGPINTKTIGGTWKAFRQQNAKWNSEVLKATKIAKIIIWTMENSKTQNISSRWVGSRLWNFYYKRNSSPKDIYRMRIWEFEEELRNGTTHMRTSAIFISDLRHTTWADIFLIHSSKNFNGGIFVWDPLNGHHEYDSVWANNLQDIQLVECEEWTKHWANSLTEKSAQ